MFVEQTGDEHVPCGLASVFRQTCSPSQKSHSTATQTFELILQTVPSAQSVSARQLLGLFEASSLHAMKETQAVNSTDVDAFRSKPINLFCISISQFESV